MKRDLGYIIDCVDETDFVEIYLNLSRSWPKPSRLGSNPGFIFKQ